MYLAKETDIHSGFHDVLNSNVLQLPTLGYWLSVFPKIIPPLNYFF